MAIGERFNAAGDVQAWVDLPSNFASLPGIDCARHLPLLMASRMPREIVHPVLHEMMHHWCFYTPVGTVLSLLHQRIQNRLLAEVLGHEVDDYELLLDLVRYETAIEALRPVTEGLALMAEHDATIEGKHLYSSPLLNLFTLGFRSLVPEAPPGRPTIIVQDDVNALVNKVLRGVRLDETGVERKANLLATPLDPAKSIYLIGYLALKNIWNQQKVKCDLLFNSDLFLSYCRSFFFQDYGMIDCLFGENDNEIGIANRVFNHVLARMNRLATGDLDADIRAWDAYDDSQSGTFDVTIMPDGDVTVHMARPRIPGLGVGTAAEASGYAKLGAQAAWLSHYAETDRILRAQKRRSAVMLATRAMMPLCSAPVTLRVAGDGLIEAEGEAGGMLARMPPQRPLTGTSGVLDYYRVPTTQQNVLILFVGGVPVSVSGSSFAEEHAAGLIETLTPSRDQIEALDSWRTFDGEIIKQRLEWFSVVTDHLQKGYPRMHRQIYGPPASFIFPQADNWEAALAQLDAKGFYSILGRNVDALLDLARLGGAASHPEARAEVAALFSEAGRDLDTCLATLGRARDRHGLVAALATDKMVASLV